MDTHVPSGNHSSAPLSFLSDPTSDSSGVGKQPIPGGSRTVQPFERSRDSGLLIRRRTLVLHQSVPTSDLLVNGTTGPLHYHPSVLPVRVWVVLSFRFGIGRWFWTWSTGSRTFTGPTDRASNTSSTCCFATHHLPWIRPDPTHERTAPGSPDVRKHLLPSGRGRVS